MIPHHWNRIIPMLLISFAALAFSLACSFGSVPIIGQAEPSATSRATRVARATFTPRPRVTETPIPPTEEPTEEPTEAPPATDVPVTVPPPPTQRPVVVVQPTNIPPPPPPAATDIPQPPPPPVSQFEYAFIAADGGACNTDDPAVCNVQNGVVCRHSGGHVIEVRVFENRADPGSSMPGMRVRFSGSPGGPPIEPDETTAYDGKAEKILSTVLDAPEHNTGNYFAWLVDGSGNPLSDFSTAIPINGLQPEDASVCWVGAVAFAG